MGAFPPLRTVQLPVDCINPSLALYAVSSVWVNTSTTCHSEITAGTDRFFQDKGTGVPARPGTACLMWCNRRAVCQVQLYLCLKRQQRHKLSKTSPVKAPELSVMIWRRSKITRNKYPQRRKDVFLLFGPYIVSVCFDCDSQYYEWSLAVGISTSSDMGQISTAQTVPPSESFDDDL